MRFSRIMISAVGSGSGKTLITCGLLKLFLNKGKRMASFKCGPDYIDPMFHEKVMGIPSGNLDAYFTDSITLQHLFCKGAAEAQLSIIEGAMGFYDGVAVSSEASAYEVAGILEAPVVLVVNCKGMSLSVIPIIKGFLLYKEKSGIAGVILNNISSALYVQLKELIEQQLSVAVLGYVPHVKELQIESRHLGLVTPGQIADIEEKLTELSYILEKTIDTQKLLSIAENAPELNCETRKYCLPKQGSVIAVAEDEAFCFRYKDNIELLRSMGAKIVPFSPLRDKRVPEHACGLILHGGYPELYAEELSKNKEMLKNIKEMIKQGMPTIAECGGFMYLHEAMITKEGERFEMVGVISGNVYPQKHLQRFGYLTLQADSESLLLKIGEAVRAHEFHYWDSENNGTDLTAVKAGREVSWKCIHAGPAIYAGFPHLYFYNYPKMAERFLHCCDTWGCRKDKKIVTYRGN